MIRALGAALMMSGIAAAADEKWVDLVGSKVDDHWITKGNWVLKDGVFNLTPREGEKGWSRFHAYLWSKGSEYTDFECEFEYKCEPKGNSGFYFHVGDVTNPVNKGIEVQIYDKHDSVAKLTDHTSGGVIPGIPPKKQMSKPAGEWNKMLVNVKGDKLTVSLNGEVVNEVDLSKGKLADRPKTGSIGFQDHALPLELKAIKVRVLK